MCNYQTLYQMNGAHASGESNDEGTSIIKGKVTTADGQPAADVTIVVKESCNHQ